MESTTAGPAPDRPRDRRGRRLLRALCLRAAMGAAYAAGGVLVAWALHR
ncbi:hypothetical protein [Kitasatospora terrestris]